MKRGWVLAVIIANLLGLAVLVFVYPHLMIAPGPLKPAHAALATDCFACHAPLGGVSAARCTSCHQIAEIGLVSTTGAALPRSDRPAFHQQLTEQNCMACHSDHEGPKLTGHSRKTFSHALLRPAVRSACETCHSPPHNAFHAGIKSNCQQCHSADAWKPAHFDHSKFFLLEPPHQAACATCHVNDDTSRYTCFGCHEHRPDRIRAEHAEEGIRNIDNCVACHRSASEGGEGGSDDD